MQYAKDAYDIPHDSVGYDVRSAGDDQFTRALDATGAAASRKPPERIHSVADPLVHRGRGMGLSTSI